MKLSGLAIVAASLAAACAANAQEIQWSQVINTPKGLNLPTGLSADLLGIELGETYASAKAKIERLHRESPAKPDNKKIDEVERSISMRLPNGSAVTARYPGFIDLKTLVPGSGKRPVEELLSVYVSAPSSGQQVIGIGRTVEYNEQADQPRIADVVARLKEKYKSEPQLYPVSNRYEIQFVFVKGRAADPRNYGITTCNADSGIQRDMPTVSSDVPRMNHQGKCDVVLRVVIPYGVSNEHAARVSFLFSDIERAKANLSADYAFFGDYVKRIQEQTKGAAPKL